jgi:hypothetical protein
VSVAETRHETFEETTLGLLEDLGADFCQRFLLHVVKRGFGDCLVLVEVVIVLLHLLFFVCFFELLEHFFLTFQLLVQFHLYLELLLLLLIQCRSFGFLSHLVVEKNHGLLFLSCNILFNGVGFRVGFAAILISL